MAASAAATYRILPDFSTPCYGPSPTPLRIPAVRFDFPSRRRRLAFRSRIKAQSTDNRTAADVEVIEDGAGGSGAISYDWNGNGSSYGSNGSLKGADGGGNGVLGGNGGSNGSLVKHVNGSVNGAAGKTEDVVLRVKSEEKQKKTVEEIGQEEVWFKRGRKDKVEVDSYVISICFEFNFSEFLERGVGDMQDTSLVSVAPGGRWNRFKTYSTIQRTLEIWGFVFTFLFKSWLNNQKFTYRGGVTEEKKVERRKALAKWLKESILRLGPTFIKIGQQFSTRVDILPQEYVDQLSELQVKQSKVESFIVLQLKLERMPTSLQIAPDQVPPFPSETAVAIIKEELGAPVDDIFDRFDYEPIAAASLGQVHRARSKGQEIVIKVQRPGLKDLFDIDLKNLRVIAEYLQKIDPKSDGAKRDWVAIYDECATVLYQEIDYTKEAANAELFASNFKDMEYVKVPTICWEYTTPQVLTMEYVPGIKINRIRALDQLGVDRQRLGRYAVESYLEQILSHGFFHADPHPGNIAVDDANGGRLIFYDFGMMGSISPNIREGLLETFYGVYEKDPDRQKIVLQAMIQMGVLVPTGDMTAVRRTAQFFLNSFEERLAAQRREREMAKAELGFKKPLSKEERIEKKKQRLAAIGKEQGDLKLRVRTLESERAFKRVAAVQKTIGNNRVTGVNLARGKDRLKPN
ncbi:Protein ACTIVITY OF BC1 COMPLEX KINASE 8, chloroplastic [Asimina triloba]